MTTCRNCISFRHVTGKGYSRRACGHPLRESISCFVHKNVSVLEKDCKDYVEGEPIRHELSEEEIDILNDIRQGYGSMSRRYRNVVRDIAEERYERA